MTRYYHHIVGTFLVCLALLVSSWAVTGVTFNSDDTLAPMDLLLAQPGWETASGLLDKKGVVHNQRSDILDAMLPRWLGLKRALNNGESPFWMHHVRAGTPGIQLLSHGAISPSFAVFMTRDDSAKGWLWSVLFRILIAGAGMYLLARCWFDRTSSLVAAVIFQSNGFILAWLYWPHTLTIIWFPWVLCCTIRILRRESIGWVAGLAICVAMMILGGFPAIAGFCLYATVLTVMVDRLLAFRSGASAAEIVGPGLMVALGTAIGILVCAPELLEQLKLLSDISLDYRSNSGSSMGVGLLSEMVRVPAGDNPPISRIYASGVVAISLAIIGLIVGLRHFRSHCQILIVAAVCTTFLLIAAGLMNWAPLGELPVFSNNPWHRARSLFPVAVALLAAIPCSLMVRFIVAKVTSSPWQKVLAGAMLVLMTCGIAMEQASLFDRLNARVPHESFFPDTPTIEYVQNRIGPLDSVMADKNFMVSGTLSPYGLREWYAHGFKTDAEKRMLNTAVVNPFRTPTAARFSGSDILVDSHALRWMGVRYLIGTRIGMKEPGFSQAERGQQRPCPALSVDPMSQEISVESGHAITRIGLQIATFKQVAQSNVEVLVSGSGSSRTYEINRTEISDNQWVDLDVANQGLTGPFDLSVRLVEPNSAKLALWCTRSPASRLKYDGDRVAKLAIKTRLETSKSPQSLWSRQSVERGIEVWERTDHSPVLLTSSLTGLDTQPTPVERLDFRPDEITIEISSPSEGWMLLPLRLGKDWTVSVNDQPTPAERFRGALPAVRVPAGSATVVWSYPSMRKGLGVLATLGSLLVLFLVICATAWKNHRAQNLDPDLSRPPPAG